MAVPIGSQLFVAAIRPHGSAALALPKGHPESDESDAAAACREVREETGLSGRIVTDLGQIDYWFYSRWDEVRVHKTVAFFLLAYSSGSSRQHDAEVSAVELVPIDDLAASLTYRGEQQIARRAVMSLQGASSDGAMAGVAVIS
jgi:8-oxo-dGTP pyrophosphatase MutT (NUDIX family)